MENRQTFMRLRRARNNARQMTSLTFSCVALLALLTGLWAAGQTPTHLLHLKSAVQAAPSAPTAEVRLALFDDTVEGVLTSRIPTGPNDYFAVHFVLPDDVQPPYTITAVRFFNNDSQTEWPRALITQATADNSQPDLQNPLAEFTNFSGPELDFLTLVPNLSVDNLNDIFFVLQFPPGDSLVLPVGDSSGAAIGIDLSKDQGYFPGNLFSFDAGRFEELLNFNLGVDMSLEFELPTSVKTGKTSPSSFILQQNYPNPFNPETTIMYDLPVDGHIELAIFNLSGSRIKTLVSEDQTTGSHSKVWDGRDDAGNHVASGIYLYRIRADNLTEVKKLTLLR